MGQETIPVGTSNRKAREERLPQFDALSAFANMGERPRAWANFRRRYPDFFPDYLTEWIYRTAHDWWRILNLSETPPDDWMDFHQKWPEMFSGSAKDWAERTVAVKKMMAINLPPLLFYRNLLRRVWWNDDLDGNRLRFLLGFESEAFREGGFELVMWKSDLPPEPPSGSRQIIDVGESSDNKFRISDLPEGKPIIDGRTGAITWEFGCPFQRAIYDLKQDRWRAMVCPQCHKYFIADKTAQKFCSSKCWGDKKAEQMREYYHRKGKMDRQMRKIKPRGAQRRKQP
jgi:hypothetical protein